MWLQGVFMIGKLVMVQGGTFYCMDSSTTLSSSSLSSSSAQLFPTGASSLSISVQMGHTSLASLSSVDNLWKQLKQSGISSLGIMNLEPKQRCIEMKAKRAALTIRKVPIYCNLTGQRVISGQQNLQQKKGKRMKPMVMTRFSDSPPLPPFRYEQLICRMRSKKASKIQKVTQFSKQQQSTKQVITPMPANILWQVSLKDFSTSSQFLKKKNAKATLTKAHSPTNLNFVSIFSSETLKNSQLATITKQKACRIIHSEMLQTDLLGLYLYTANRNMQVKKP